MRMLLKASVPMDQGNEAIRNGSLPTKIEAILRDLQPEAAYFGEMDGLRTAFIVVDIADASQIPAKVEPLFLAFGARVEIHPVMTAEDLMKGGPGLEQAVKNHG